MVGSGLIGTSLLITALLTLSPAGTALEVRDWNDGGRLLERVPMDGSDTFRLVFTHSMYGGTVSETYRVVDAPSAMLERSEVRTETGGAAEYYAPLGNFRRDGTGWIVDVPPMVMADLNMAVTHIGNPAIVTGNSRVELTALLPDGHAAELVPVLR